MVDVKSSISTACRDTCFCCLRSAAFSFLRANMPLTPLKGALRAFMTDVCSWLVASMFKELQPRAAPRCISSSQSEQQQHYVHVSCLHCPGRQAKTRYAAVTKTASLSASPLDALHAWGTPTPARQHHQHETVTSTRHVVKLT